MTYRGYYVRAIENDWDAALYSLAADGILIETDFGHAAANGSWDYIGPVYKGTGEFATIEGIEVELTEPVKDENGNIYLHANLRTPMELSSPYFIQAPANPARVFFGD
jgi:hypothetical protein